MRNQTNLSELFNRYVNNECSPEEIELLLQHFDAREDELLLKDLIRTRLEGGQDTQDTSNPVLQYAFISIKEQIRFQNSGNAPVIGMWGKSWKRYAAAAAIIIVLGCSVWFRLVQQASKHASEVAMGSLQHEILPGGNRATLTLADGSIILLDSAVQGALGSQGGTHIIKLSDGQLAYRSASGSDTSSSGPTELYNTISTPKGGQYQIILPDGSSVWLNAASSLRFPARFLKSGRQVELTGEAYFEIAQQAGAPFIVKHNNTEVQVLGTSFNMNAYSDEGEIRTTLLVGSVRVINNQSNVLLKPGQRASIETSRNLPNPSIRVEVADTDDAIAWKNGMFVFNNADIATIMRQVSRWYDVDVKFEGSIPKDKFIGEVARNSNISEVLKILELSNINFKINGKTITVIP